MGPNQGPSPSGAQFQAQVGPIWVPTPFANWAAIQVGEGGGSELGWVEHYTGVDTGFPEGGFPHSGGGGGGGGDRSRSRTLCIGFQYRDKFGGGGGGGG